MGPRKMCLYFSCRDRARCLWARRCFCVPYLHRLIDLFVEPLSLRQAFAAAPMDAFVEPVFGERSLFEFIACMLPSQADMAGRG